MVLLIEQLKKGTTLGHHFNEHLVLLGHLLVYVVCGLLFHPVIQESKRFKQYAIGGSILLLGFVLTQSSEMGHWFIPIAYISAALFWVFLGLMAGKRLFTRQALFSSVTIYKNRVVLLNIFCIAILFGGLGLTKSRESRDIINGMYLTIGLIVFSLKLIYRMLGVIFPQKSLFQLTNTVRTILTTISVITATIILLGLGESNERDYWLFNGYIALTWLFVIYHGFSFFSKYEDRITANPFLKKYRKLIFYLLAFPFLIVGINTTTDNGLFSPRGQFILLFGILLIYLIFSWVFNQWRLIKQLKSERTHAQLLHLKSQVNPHFFFNTLNNLYGLIPRKPDQAQALVLKLSDMMRYSIYEGQKDDVPLEEEVAYLTNFIELHRLRYHKLVDIQFIKHIQDEGIQVTPLLFIILLENAFKHGVDSQTDHAYVHVELIASDTSIHFVVENNYEEDQDKTHQGIGLKNLQQRLLLLYPNKHNLTVTDHQSSYRVKLELDLS